MGLLVDGQWRDEWYDTKSTAGRFVRKESSFRNRVTADGSSGFRAEPARYHLYVSLACPWAHRTLIFRRLKKLEDIISVSVVDPLMAEQGWAFSEGPGCIPDTVNGARYLHQVYTAARPDYTGRDRTCSLGQGRRNHRQQRVVRNHPDAEHGVRRLCRQGSGFLPSGSSARDRQDQCPGL